MLRCNVSREGETIPIYLYLLSNDIRVMIRLDFECAVVCPQVDRGRDACDAAFVDLMFISRLYTFADKTNKLTISAASVPAIENSRSAYFFQYPNSKGNLARNRSYAFRTVVIACGFEFRLIPPSRDSAPRTSFSHVSKLSGSSTCRTDVSHACYGRSQKEMITSSASSFLSSAFSSSEPPKK